MPDISNFLVAKAYMNVLIRYTGTTNANFTNDTVYMCTQTQSGYEWTAPDNSFTNRPMTEAEAKNILSRLKTTINTRLANTVDTSVESLPIINDARMIKSKEETTGKLKTSRLNINAISEGSTFKIHNTPESYDPSETDVDLSMDQIMKAIDGVAIINSILGFNDIDKNVISSFGNNIDQSLGQVTKTPTGAAEYKTIKDGVEYKYTRITQTSIKNARQKLYDVIRRNVVAGGKGYKIYGLVTPASGDPATTNINAVNMEKTTAQIGYVNDMLNNRIPQLIKYVQDFVQASTTPGSRNDTGNQNITSAFDFYVLDYVTQVLEAETELYVAIRRAYGKKTPDAQGHYSSGDEYFQQNKAPFMSSMCNGACAGLCYGSCIGTCNGCGGCTSYCTSECGGTCATECALNCRGACQGTCIDECQGTCNDQCTSACYSDCNINCGINCTGKCISACSTKCQNGCLGGCKTTCDSGCKNTCEENCGEGCETSSASKALPQTTEPKNVIVHHDDPNPNKGNVNRGGGGPSTHGFWDPEHNVPQVAVLEGGNWVNPSTGQPVPDEAITKPGDSNPYR